MDELESNRQRILIAQDSASRNPSALLEDNRDEWDSLAGYIESDSLSMCPSCRQIETMELAVGGNDFSEYKCSFCGQQVRLEDDE